MRIERFIPAARPLKRVQKNRRLTFNAFRNFFWKYPDKILPFFENIVCKFKKTYRESKPIGPLILALLFICFTVLLVYFLEFSLRIPPKMQFTEGMLGIPEKINPIYIPQLQVEKDINELVYNSLFEVRKDGSVVGELAEAWEFRDDGKQLHLKLKKEITWHDGVKFTSSDVAYTVSLYKDLQGQDSYFNTVENIEAEIISENEILLKIDRPTASFLETISWPILPEHLLSNYSIPDLEKIDFSEIPGTGSFKFNYKKGNEIRLSNNESYWKKSPGIKTLILEAYPKENDLINALLSGRIDATPELSPLNIPALENIKWLRYDNISLLRRYWSVYLNFNGPEILKDKRVRQALSYTVNRERIINEVMKGYALESTGPIQEKSWAYNEDVKRYNYDIEEAQKLFKEVGYEILENEKYLSKDGQTLKIELGYVTNPIQDEVAKYIAEDWEKAGVMVELNGLTYTEFRDTLLIPRNFETILFGVESLLDPDHLILWHSSQSVPPGRNFSSYKSSYTGIEGINRVDDLLEKGKNTLEQEKRKEIYTKFQQYLLDDSPAIFLYHPSFIYVHNKRITGINLEDVTLPEERFKNIEEWRIE